MSSIKRLGGNLSEVLLPEVNEAQKKDSLNKNNVRANGLLYIEESNNEFIEEMKRGYLEMAELNLEYSEFGFESYINELNEYENQLSESEMPNDDDACEKRRYFLC